MVSTPVGGQLRLIVKGRLIRLEHDSVAIDAGDARTGPQIETFDLRGVWQLERFAGTRGHRGQRCSEPLPGPPPWAAFSSPEAIVTGGVIST